MRHEGVVKTSKMCPIAHFFSEDVRWIYFSGNVQHIKGLVLHPFATRVLLELNMMNSLGSHVV